ncbi:MAG: transcription antitermination factor NusB [FCB group bacterium]|nr:transcription antitermination factor NusB [FCB group bacterium]
MIQESLRHRAREIVLKTLYAYEQGGKESNKIFENLLEKEELNKKNVEFAHTLLKLVLENIPWADEHIAQLAENWELKRIAVIDHHILRMGLVELEKIPSTPIKVVINEALELAKEYSTLESFKFINGILDSYIKKKEDS